MDVDELLDDRRLLRDLERWLAEDDWRRLRRCGCFHCQQRAREMERELFGHILTPHDNCGVNDKPPACPCIC